MDSGPLLGLLFLVIGSGVLSGCAALLTYYDGRLRNDIRKLEPEYERIYGEKPRGSLNETFGALEDYRTFLNYAIMCQKR
jgi:hypothetical protein